MNDLTRRDFVIPIERYDPESRTVSGVISSSALDHWGDQIDQDGIRVRSTVPLLWAHDARKPIGRSLGIQRNGDKTSASFRLASAGIDPTADRIHALAKDGVISSLSVGLLPKRWEGNVLRESELLEVSLVSLGANPDATVTAVRAAPEQEQSPMMVTDRTGIARAAGNGNQRIAAPAILRRDPDVHNWSFGRFVALALDDRNANIDWTLEREVSDQLNKLHSLRSGAKAPMLEMVRPLLQRAIGTKPGDPAAALTSVDYRGEMFGLDVEAIKPALLMGRIGAQVITTSEPMVVIPRQNGPLPPPQWVARDAALTVESDINTRSIDLVPHEIGSYFELKRSALKYGVPSIMGLYQTQMVEGQLLEIDSQVLYGTGVAPRPSGIITDARLQTFQFGGAPAVVAPSLGDLTTMAGLLDGSTAPEANRVWIMNSLLRSTLQATRKLTGSTDSVTILEEGDTTLLAHPIVTAPQIPVRTVDNSTDLWLVDGALLGLCFFADGAWTVEVLPNPYGSAYASGGVQLIAFNDVAPFWLDAYRAVHSVNPKSIGKPGTPVAPSMATTGAARSSPGVNGRR